MFTTKLDWDKAHERTKKVVVDHCALVELDEDGIALRSHTLYGLMETEVPRPVKVKLPSAGDGSAAVPCPPSHAPCAPGAPTPQFVKMNKYQFDQLLATIKEHATNSNVRDNAKLTHMQIHEKLLGLVEHD